MCKIPPGELSLTEMAAPALHFIIRFSSLDNGNGGAATPVIQSGASLQYMTTGGGIGGLFGNVGIGTSTPGTQFAVEGGGSSEFQGPIVLDGSATNNAGLTMASSSAWFLYQNNDRSLHISRFGYDPVIQITYPNNNFIYNGNGDFGIGTTSPAATFSTNGNEYTTGGVGVGVLNTTAGTIQSSGNILGGGTLALSGTVGTSTIASGEGFTVGGSQFVVQQGSGNVGIGTNAPSYSLSVNTNGSQNTNGIHVQGFDGHYIDIRPSLSGGSNNPIVQAGDEGIVFTNNAVDTGAFDITPWSASTKGIRSTWLIRQRRHRHDHSRLTSFSLNNIANFTTATSTFY